MPAVQVFQYFVTNIDGRPIQGGSLSQARTIELGDGEVFDQTFKVAAEGITKIFDTTENEALSTFDFLWLESDFNVLVQFTTATTDAYDVKELAGSGVAGVMGPALVLGSDDTQLLNGAIGHVRRNGVHDQRDLGEERKHIGHGPRQNRCGDIAMAVDYDRIKGEIAHFIGEPEEKWSDLTTSAVDFCIRKGIDSVVHCGMHQWSWMRPTWKWQTSDGQRNYTLPVDFEQFIGDIHYDGEQYAYSPITQFASRDAAPAVHRLRQHRDADELRLGVAGARRGDPTAAATRPAPDARRHL